MVRLLRRWVGLPAGPPALPEIHTRLNTCSPSGDMLGRLSANSFFSFACKLDRGKRSLTHAFFINDLPSWL